MKQGNSPIPPVYALDCSIALFWSKVIAQLHRLIHTYQVSSTRQRRRELYSSFLFPVDFDNENHKHHIVSI